jgi:serine phosphatase RsbU (regulator of sigma subunit)
MGKFSSKLGFAKKTPLIDLLPVILNPEDPRVAIRALGNDWICPFTGARLETPTWDGAPDSLMLCQEIVDFLLAVPVLQKNPERALMKSFEELAERAMFFRLQQFPHYRQSDEKGEWICPYCLKKTSVMLVQWDGTEDAPEVFVPRALAHLRTCEAYKASPLVAKSSAEIRESFGDDALRIDLTKLITNDPRFNIYEDNGHWICPYSVHPIESIRKPVIAGQGIDINGILRHVMNPNQCPAHYSNWKVETTLQELSRVAGRISENRQQTVRITAAEAEMAKLRGHVHELAQRVSSAAEMEHDIDAARKVQLKMLPEKPPRIDGYEIAAFYQPCAQLGGDLYNFLDAGPGKTGFLVGDVSGHGVSAAVIMAMAQKAFSMRAAGKAAPAPVIVEVNTDLIKDMPRGKFVSAFYGVLEIDSGVFRYSRAGHPPPYLLVPGQGVRALEGNGLALALGPAAIFEKKLEQIETALPPGSTLLIYTDGIPEAMNAAKEEFTEEALSATMAECEGLSAQETILYVLSVVRGHVGAIPMEDDLTLIAIKRLNA